MFTKTLNNDIALLHGFIKRSQKTPKKDAKVAIGNLERIKNNVEVTQLPLAKYSF
jgi:phage-related protein